MKKYQLSEKEASNILEDVLERCEIEKNTVPLETLLSYSNYRKERYALQKRIIAIVMLIFIVLPFFFFTLTMSIEKKESQYLMLYELKVKNYFPIEKITATINDKEMPIYETSDENYVIKATKNGEMIVTVQLWNKQMKTQTIQVEGCDETPPALVTYEKVDDLVYIYVEEYESGIKYDSAYALLEGGIKEKPISYDTNYFVFQLKPCDVYILDYAGNKLHITLK